MYIDGDTTYFNKVVSGDIDVTICYDGTLLVDGREVCDIYNMVAEINAKKLELFMMK